MKNNILFKVFFLPHNLLPLASALRGGRTINPHPPSDLVYKDSDLTSRKTQL